MGGGSITALPIIETLVGDISAYIPTNVISITDGQIFLESELFHSGFRPAVNVGLSVSRVGGSAQTKAMKHVAGSLRLELAQYRELQVFSQFGSDLDAATRERLNHGEKLMETLKQNLHSPVPMEEQVIILLNAKERYLDSVLFYDVLRYNTGLISFFREKAAELLAGIRETGQLSSEAESAAKDLCEEYSRSFKPSSTGSQDISL